MTCLWNMTIYGDMEEECKMPSCRRIVSFNDMAVVDVCESHYHIAKERLDNDVTVEVLEIG